MSTGRNREQPATTGKRPNGRPTSLTPDVREKIVNAIRAGNYAEQAAQYAGVHRSTYFRWMQRADEEPGSIFSDFRDAVKEAEASAEAYAVAMVRQAMPSSWQAAMTFLERKHPERWRRREVHEHTGPDGGPMMLQAPPDAADRAARAAELLARSGAVNGSNGSGSNGHG